MNPITSTTSQSSQKETGCLSLKHLLLVLGVIVLGFAFPLFKLAKFSFNSELYSYILLIPFISAHIIWTERKLLPLDNFCTSQTPGTAAQKKWSALILLSLGMLLVAFYGVYLTNQPRVTAVDRLAVTTGAFLCFVWGACFWLLNAKLLRKTAFPLAFLFFMVPMPSIVEQVVVTVLQHGSADAAAMLFFLSGTSFVRDVTYFQLPGISLQVAPECSGIHSTLVLFIVSTVGAYHFLRTPWKRVLLCLFILPLALLRNGFRVFVLGMLCVHVNPNMINSPIHHRGGPIFFALSLIPFLLVVFWLRKSEKIPTTTPKISDTINQNKAVSDTKH